MHRDGMIYLGSSFSPDTQEPRPQYIDLKRANRHGLIAGATGTGKTVSLQILAEGFSDAGVPVFCADIKGDLSGIAARGEVKDFIGERADKIGFSEFDYCDFPTVFWDLFGENGHSIRTTITEMGPLLLSRLMNLNPTQEGVLNIAFELADDEGLLLLDMKDLRAILTEIGSRAKELSLVYGNVSKASVGAIQRQLLVLEREGGEAFFGEPALDIRDLMRTTRDGRGVINVLSAARLMASPRLYATFLLWLLSELFEELPEVGDPDKPRLVFFFDEAHLLFDEAPKVLIEKVEQIVRLIRSKGVGVYFVTQNPDDVPESVLSQLGNRVQHALRAYTPRERKAVRTAAETFRPNAEFETEDVISELGIGEALVSTLGGKGVPSVVERTLIRPPSSRLGPLTQAELRQTIQASPIFGLYDRTRDRESAYEILQSKALEKSLQEEREREREDAEREKGKQRRRTRTGFTVPEFGRDDRPRSSSRRSTTRRRSQRQTVTEAAVKSVVRSLSSSLGRALARGILGSLKRGG